MGTIMRLYRFMRLLGLRAPIHEVSELKLALPRLTDMTRLTDMRNRYEGEEVQEKAYRGSDISDDAPAGETRDKER